MSQQEYLLHLYIGFDYVRLNRKHVYCHFFYKMIGLFLKMFNQIFFCINLSHCLEVET